MSVQFSDIKHIHIVRKPINIIHLQKIFIIPSWNSVPYSFFLQPLVTILLSISVNLAMLGTSYKWNHAIIILLWLLFFLLASCPGGSSMLQDVSEFNLFLRLHSIPFWHRPQFVYPFICWRTFGLFTHFGYCEHTAINICLQVTFQVSAFHSFVCLPSSGTVDHSMTNLLRACHSIFHCGYPALYPHQQYTWVPDSSCPCKHLFSDFGVIALLMGMKWYHIMVLICISLMIMTVSIFYNAYWVF